MERKLGLNTSLEAQLRNIKKFVDRPEPDVEELQLAFISLLDLLIEREQIRPVRGIMSDYAGNGNPTVLG